MNALFSWLDHRTGYRAFVHEALYERIPGGARWRYVWGSTLVFAFFVQVVTGIFLWMSYSPSAQTAWESVYYIQFQLQGGWLLRGLHHFMSQAMVVLLALHLLQVVIDGAYRAPREINFWLGLILMQIVLGLSLTGYLLPWDQKGFWATRVATNLLSLVPVVGNNLQEVIVGGGDYGHHTLTRFFALHAGVLPGLLILFLVLHVALFRRHGITHKLPVKRPDATFWPDQVLRDAVASLGVLIVVLLLTIHFNVGGLVRGELAAANTGSELGPPADGVNPYKAARPEWYFLFLYQFLKLFEGEAERWGALYIPGIVMLVMFLMPLVGRWKWGHRFNVAFTIALLLGIVGLTAAAYWEDHRSKWTDAAQFNEIAELAEKLGRDDQKIAAYFERDNAKIADYRSRLNGYEAYRKSLDYLSAVEQSDQDAKRAIELASGPAQIPSTGALAMLREDPAFQGPRLFAEHCASCHTYLSPDVVDSPAAKQHLEKASAPNLHGFGSRDWIAGLLDPKKIVGREYFGCTTRYKELKAKDELMEMVEFVLGDLKEWPKEEVEQVVAALSAQAQLPAQRADEEDDQELIDAGRLMIAEDARCVSCHRFKPEWPPGDPRLRDNESGNPDLTRYASREWMIGMISNPTAPRFYGKKNDRMPAFAADETDPAKNILTRRQIELIVDWLRGDFYSPPGE